MSGKHFFVNLLPLYGVVVFFIVQKISTKFSFSFHIQIEENKIHFENKTSIILLIKFHSLGTQVSNFLRHIIIDLENNYCLLKNLDEELRQKKLFFKFCVMLHMPKPFEVHSFRSLLCSFVQRPFFLYVCSIHYGQPSLKVYIIECLPKSTY